MTPGEKQWREYFADEYGIPPIARFSAYDAPRAHFGPARRKPDEEAQWQKLRAVFAKKDAAQ